MSMKKYLSFLSVLLPAISFAQAGFTLGPYFLTPNFGSVNYGQENKIGNNQSIGGFFNLNIKQRVNINVSHLEFLSDRFGDGSAPKLGYGLDGRPVYKHVPIRQSELLVGITLHHKDLFKNNDWLGGSPVARTVGIRAGIHTSSRLVQLKPRKVNFVGPDMDGNVVPQYDFISWYDITGVHQQMFCAGLAVDKYKAVEQFRNPFNRNKGKNRNRVYQQYFDVLYAFGNRYDDYGVDSFSFSGASVPDVVRLGWRAGFRRVTYNNLGHSFVCEFGQYPGQRRKSEAGATGIDADKNFWKNWFVFVGFHISIGHWWGDF